jgi:serine/threonine protein kinase
VHSNSDRPKSDLNHICEGEIPSQIGSYIVEALIESNDYHECYRGFDLVKKIPVFIKRLTPHAQRSQGPTKDYFSREIRILRTLNHPNLCSMLQAGMENGRPYLVCSYVFGITLREFLIQEFPRPNESLFIIRQIALALSYLHTKQIIHNDLKPENIIITPSLEAILIDFSIAERLGGHQDLKINQLVGTLLYMSPERQSQSSPTSTASDLYSFAIICYELITGRLSQGTIQLSSLPKPLQTVFAKSLQSDPKMRYASINDFLLEIEQHKQSLPGIHLPLRISKPNIELLDVDSKGSVFKQEGLEAVFVSSSSFQGENEILSCGFDGKHESLSMIQLRSPDRSLLYYLKGQIQGFDQKKWKSPIFMQWLDWFTTENIIEKDSLNAVWVQTTLKHFQIWLHGSMMAICLQPKNINQPLLVVESIGPWKQALFPRDDLFPQTILIFPKNGLSSEIILQEILPLAKLCGRDLYALCHVISRRLSDLFTKITAHFFYPNRIALPTLGLNSCTFSTQFCKKILPEGEDNV